MFKGGRSIKVEESLGEWGKEPAGGCVCGPGSPGSLKEWGKDNIRKGKLKQGKGREGGKASKGKWGDF